MANELRNINQIKGEILKYDNELNSIKEKNIVFKTKYEQCLKDKEEFIIELQEKGIEVDNIENLIREKLVTLNEVLDKINNLLNGKEVNVIADNIDFKDVDFEI